MITCVNYDSEKKEFFTFKHRKSQRVPIDDNFTNAVYEGLVKLKKALNRMEEELSCYSIYRIKHKDILKLKYEYDCADFLNYVEFFRDDEYCYFIELDC